MKKNLFSWLSRLPFFFACLALLWIMAFPWRSHHLTQLLYAIGISSGFGLLGLIFGVISLAKKEPARLVTWVFLVVNAIFVLCLIFVITAMSVR